MSDRMTCMPFSQLLNWVFAEKSKKGTVFGIHNPFIPKKKRALNLFGRNLETAIGPAAGPQTQLAQNIIAAYYAGGRFFEVKTVQKIDGEDLKVTKPCINADDEGYNIEWSTELTVPEAQDEYIKAWVILHLIAKEFGLGDQDGFQFNMSVGYDLAGIKLPKMDLFIENMKEAKNTESFKEAIAEAKAHMHLFRQVTEKDIDAIPSAICNSATISTLHGCPPQEIESIAEFLIGEKNLNCFVKCNPTLLGYDFARKTVDEMGYDYLVFGKFHFEDDLQYKDAIPMFKRLMKLANGKGLVFGAKLTNTFPVDIKYNELAGEEMYMSGKVLFPLTIALAAKISEDMDGKMPISYSGGADTYNIDRIVSTGIWPVTMATTLLKPGGYQRLKQLAEKLEAQGYKPFNGIDVKALKALAESAKKEKHYLKGIKNLPSRKNPRSVPLVDCFTAGCEESCPIHQDIPNYIQLTGEKKYEEAFRVILDKNALPFITGTLCAHPCQGGCIRNTYEEPVRIRSVKLEAAENGYAGVIKSLKPLANLNKRVAVVGGGPSGMSAAFFLARAGAKVTLFERNAELGGLIRYVIPHFRISKETIAKDVSLLTQLGVEIKTGTQVTSVADLKSQGFDSIVLAVGAYNPGNVRVENCTPLNAIEFLEEFNVTKGKVKLGKNVVVIGAGNTAMDVARSAKANDGVDNVMIVYRRTKRYMPADEEELVMALEDGVQIRELLAPVKLTDGKLSCRVMALGERDASNRPSVVDTGKMDEVLADVVIAAVGEAIDSEFYKANGIEVDDRGHAKVNRKTLETNVEGVYVTGDGLNGPSTIVQAIHTSTVVAQAILDDKVAKEIEKIGRLDEIYAKRGVLLTSGEAVHENERCLSCSTVCENCVEVCPNRANISVVVPGRKTAQIVHVDYMCNECGNCETFCPYSSGPYRDKYTLFANEADMADSKNKGFVVMDPEKNEFKVRLFGKEPVVVRDGEPGTIPASIIDLMKAVAQDYNHMLIE